MAFPRFLTTLFKGATVMYRVLAFVFVLSSLAFSVEPSVYGAGDLDSNNPYGLSSSEKKIVQNSKKLKSFEKTLKMLQFKYNDLQEKLDGTRSVTESISNKIGKIDGKIHQIDTKDSNKTATIQSLKEDIETLREQFNDNLTVQNTNQKKIKSVLSELSSLIDSINSNYVSKDEFNRYIKKQNSKKSLSNKSGAELLSEARKLFKKKLYDEARVRYEKLVAMGYMPARSNFNLGEISYHQKKYNQAIAYYKKSISLYDKATYTPTLLYHTGISLTKLKKNREASKFFNVLKSRYPNSKEAKSLK